MRAAMASLGLALRRIGARAAHRAPAIRPIRRSDAQAVQTFVSTLSDRSRTLRFFRPLRELPPDQLERMIKADGSRDRVLVALERAGASTRIVGLAQYALEADTRCDFALVIADQWQGRGLGRRLLRALLVQAAHAGVKQMHGDVLRENRAMLGLARATGFSVAHSPLDASAVRIVRALDGAEPRRIVTMTPYLPRTA